MTDIEMIKAMLTRAGIDYEESTVCEGAHNAGMPQVSVYRGYTGFVTDMTFDKDTGALIDMGAWE